MDEIVLDFSNVDKDLKLADLLKEYDATFRNLTSKATKLTLHIEKEDLYAALLTNVLIACSTPDKFVDARRLAKHIMETLEVATIEDAAKSLKAGIMFTDINLS